MVKIKVKLVDPNAKMPHFAGPYETGADLYSVEAGILEPGARAAVSVGIKVAPNHMMDKVDIQIRPRSGLAFKHGVTVLNSPGTIDKSYRGIVKVILVNLGIDRWNYNPGDRIAQMVVAPHYTDVEFVEVEELEETDRNESGFGSTGV